MLAIYMYRYEFWKTPDDLQYAADRMSGRATWQLYAHGADNALTSCVMTLSSWSLFARIKASLTVSTIHLLIWLLMMSYMTGLQWMKSHWCPHPHHTPVSCRQCLSCVTEHSILSGSPGLRCVIPGTVIQSGAWDGSWFLARNPASGNKDTTFWHWVFPLPNTHLPDATLSAYRYDHRQAEANSNRNTVFIDHHLRSMTSMEILPWSSSSDANGGLINADRASCRYHLGKIRRCTGHSSLNALLSSLLCRSADGSFF